MDERLPVVSVDQDMWELAASAYARGIPVVAVDFAGFAPTGAHRFAAGGYPHAFGEHHRRTAGLVLDGLDNAGEVGGVHQQLLDPQQAAAGAPPKPATWPTKDRRAKCASFSTISLAANGEIVALRQGNNPDCVETRPTQASALRLRSGQAAIGGIDLGLGFKIRVDRRRLVPGFL